ncbi:MAG: energy transducer TonB [Chthoniobacteraceae bacterium]|nr:energy transducer TonB [Chthoniobacteraceae bacterium]
MSAQNSDTRSAVSLLFCAILAVGFHAGILYAWKYQPKEAGRIQVLDDSVEVALVESSSASSETVSEAGPALVVPPREPVSVPEAPVPTPVPEPMPSPKEKSLPPSPKELPPLSPKPKPPVAAVKAPPSGKPAESIPAKGSTVGTVGDSSGKLLGKPLYLVRPQVNYPAESRAAGEQGVVLLRITVNANGRPSAVSVAGSSGFPRLDKAAVEGGWRCKVSNAFDGAQFEAPLRFSLQDR